MLRTHEMRWFFREALNEGESLLASSGLTFANCVTRNDFYLVVSGKKDLGIKLRENRIEIKQRHRDGRSVRLSSRVTGIQEGWTKWSLSVAENDDVAAAITSGKSTWLRVEKNVIGFKAVSENQTTFLSMAEQATRGCQVDYTRLTIEGEQWFTLGFEWFGDASPHLEADVQHSVLGNLRLGLGASMGYPQFLQERVMCSVPTSKVRA